MAEKIRKSTCSHKLLTISKFSVIFKQASNGKNITV